MNFLQENKDFSIQRRDILILSGCSVTVVTLPGVYQYQLDWADAKQLQKITLLAFRAYLATEPASPGLAASDTPQLFSISSPLLSSSSTSYPCRFFLHPTRMRMFKTFLILQLGEFARSCRNHFRSNHWLIAYLSIDFWSGEFGFLLTFYIYILLGPGFVHELSTPDVNEVVLIIVVSRPARPQ